MTKARYKGFLCGVLGAFMGLGGVVSRVQCSSAGCGTCLGCAWTGVFVVALALVGRKKVRRKEEDHGVA